MVSVNALQTEEQSLSPADNCPFIDIFCSYVKDK